MTSEKLRAVRAATDDSSSSVTTTRRSFLRMMAGAGAIAVAPTAFAGMARATPERSLKFHNLHTGENLAATYWADGRYLKDGLKEINWILRDFRSGDVAEIHPELLDLLVALHGKLQANAPFHVISGYRSPATNAKLRSHSSGVAKHSLHMKAMAIDIRVPGCDLKDLRRAAMQLKGGGVGYYAKSNFVHVDVGRVRYW
jgi:uncharacterized protein YcbK (DUF882 family)